MLGLALEYLKPQVQMRTPESASGATGATAAAEAASPPTSPVVVTVVAAASAVEGAAGARAAAGTAGGTGEPSGPPERSMSKVVRETRILVQETGFFGLSPSDHNYLSLTKTGLTHDRRGPQQK